MRLAFLTLAVPALLHGLQASRSSPQPPDHILLRESLRAADVAFSSASATKGFVATMAEAISPDVAILIDGAPIVHGASPVRELLLAQPSLRDVRVSWQPIRALVSADGTLGVTIGFTSILGPSVDQHRFGRYVSVWRAGTSNSWQLVAHVQTGLPVSQSDIVLPSSAFDGVKGRPTPQGEFAQADLAFAQMAKDRSASAAFESFSAPDGITFAGTGELNVGPANIRARMHANGADRSRWQWWPRLVIASPSADLGATIGEAEILQEGSATPALSKYVTIWVRQPDGSLKYVVDAGNSRPAR